jgi:hypothetical protein
MTGVTAITFSYFGWRARDMIACVAIWCLGSWCFAIFIRWILWCLQVFTAWWCFRRTDLKIIRSILHFCRARALLSWSVWLFEPRLDRLIIQIKRKFSHRQSISRNALDKQMQHDGQKHVKTKLFRTGNGNYENIPDSPLNLWSRRPFDLFRDLHFTAIFKEFSWLLFRGSS